MSSIKDLRNKTPAELQKHVVKLREDIAEFKREKRIAKVGNIRKVGNLKREVARVLTVINEQEKDTKENK